MPNANGKAFAVIVRGAMMVLLSSTDEDDGVCDEKLK
jgi:hypothetical protein